MISIQLSGAGTIALEWTSVAPASAGGMMAAQLLEGLTDGFAGQLLSRLERFRDEDPSSALDTDLPRRRLDLDAAVAPADLQAHAGDDPRLLAQRFGQRQPARCVDSRGFRHRKRRLSGLVAASPNLPSIIMLGRECR